MSNLIKRISLAHHTADPMYSWHDVSEDGLCCHEHARERVALLEAENKQLRAVVATIIRWDELTNIDWTDISNTRALHEARCRRDVALAAYEEWRKANQGKVSDESA